MITAVIFDLDGLLIDSEPLWQQAEIEIFATVGLHLTRQDCQQTMGFRIDEAVAYWYNKQPWAGPTILDIIEAVMARLLQLVKEQGKPLSGVITTLEFFKHKNIPMAVASSSHLHIIEQALEAIGVRHYFANICSAQFEEYGKPHPAIFITAAKNLHTPPVNCLVFEDSFYGLIAAKAAKMKAVAVPEHANLSNPKYAIADVTLRSLEDWNEEVFQSLQ